MRRVRRRSGTASVIATLMQVRYAAAMLALLVSMWCPSAALANAPPSGGEVVSAVQAHPPQLLEKAELSYPEEAEASLVHGDVLVRVQVAASGEITEVTVVSGPELFHAEAVAAGRRLRFAPARLAGEPVAGSVLVSFHFAPPGAVVEGAPVDELVVIGEDVDRHDTHARQTLRQEELERATGDDLATTVSVVSGVAVSRGTIDANKPLIRGQTERRLLLLHDGIRHESQKWGPDHAPEIDPFTAGTISVVKGAAGARYGPDAIGGVVLVEPPAMRDAVGVGGKAVLQGASNGRRGYAALRLDAVPARWPGLTMRLEGNVSRSASQRAPDYVLGNTASALWNLGGAVEVRSGRSTFRVTAHHYDLRAGIYYGVRNATPDEFLSQIELERPVTADQWVSDYGIDERPFQVVRHDRVAAHWTHEGERGTQVEATYAFQLNRREEFDTVRNENDRDSQYNFLLRTHTLDAMVNHVPRRLARSELTGGIGIQGIFQENIYNGLTLLPNYRGFGASLFGFERLETGGRWAFELGLRGDWLDRASFLDDNDFDRGVREGVLDDTRCPFATARYRCPGVWSTGSVSAGAIWHAIDDHVDVKMDLSSASRFPNPDELYLIGTAPSFPVYAVGNPSLGVETTYNGSGTLGVSLGGLDGELSGWGSYVDDYIYFSPALTPDGEPRFDVTIRGAWPRYLHTPIPAAFWGADGHVDMGAEALVGLRLAGALVRARDLESGAFLIGTPPDRLAATVMLRPVVGTLRDTRLALTLNGVARQSRTDPQADFAPVPNGYVLLGAAVETTVPIGEREARIGLRGENLLNARYRDYTSLLRYYGDFPGVDVRLRIAVDL